MIDGCHGGFPTRVGMDRHFHFRVGVLARIPHPRGDGPAMLHQRRNPAYSIDELKDLILGQPQLSHD